MLKWTVSRSLSSVGSTPHATATSAADPSQPGPASGKVGPAAGGRRPFRDLSNTPPPAASGSARANSSGRPNARTLLARERDSGAGPLGRTPARSKRRKSGHATDLRAYFHSTKPSTRSEKRRTSGRSSPIVVESFYQSTPRVDLDIGPLLALPGRAEPLKPLKLADQLQSHVSDFFQQISMATSPEDVMESESVPFARARFAPHADPDADPNADTPRIPRPRFNPARHPPHKISDKKVAEEEEEAAEEARLGSAGDDSSISSASQLLDNPSPDSWPADSPGLDQLAAEFPLKRQRVIRRKRTATAAVAAATGNGNPEPAASQPKRPRSDELPFIEAVNRHVRKLQLETDLDSFALEAEHGQEPAAAHPTPSRTHTPPPKIALTEEAQREWDTPSPKSSLLDSFATTTTTTTTTVATTSAVKGTPDSCVAAANAPLVATVRRCLRYSPETPNGSLQRSRSPLAGSIQIECSAHQDHVQVNIIRCRELRRANDGPVAAYVKASIGGCVKRTAVHRPTANPEFHESLLLPCPGPAERLLSLDIAVWHRDRRARRSELLGCMTLPLPLSQDKEAQWHPLEAGSGRNASCATLAGTRDSLASPPLSKDGAESLADNSSAGGGHHHQFGQQLGDELAYLRHIELEPLDPVTGLPVNPGFVARGGRTPCTVTRTLVRPHTQPGNANQVAWGFSLSWGRPPRVERVDPGSLAERSGLRPGDHVVFVGTRNVVTLPRDEVLQLVQAATSQLVLEVYRRPGSAASRRRSSIVLAPLVPLTTVATVAQQQGQHQQHRPSVAFTAEGLGRLAADAPPEEELMAREARYWRWLKSGQAQLWGPLGERRDVLSAADHAILFQNLDELARLSGQIREEGGTLDCYLRRLASIDRAYRRYVAGLQRACCLLLALRHNSAFAGIIAEPAKPDLTGLLLQPLEHYREMTRLLLAGCGRNCAAVRELAQGYREATASAQLMEPPRDSGKPLLSLQEVESRLVFARCKPFTLVAPTRHWLFGGALAKAEGRARCSPTWALLLTDLLVFARVSRDRVLFVTEEPLRLACIAEACFNVRKRPTEFRLQLTTQPSGQGADGGDMGSGELVQCGGIGGGGPGGGGGVSTGCSPHSRSRRRLVVLRAPSPELKAVWHNLLQRQIIYVNTGYGDPTGSGLDSPVLDDSLAHQLSLLPQSSQRDLNASPEVYRSAQQLEAQLDEPRRSADDSLELVLSNQSTESTAAAAAAAEQHRNDNHLLAQWVRNSHQIPPPDHELPIEEWTPEQLAARTPRDAHASPNHFSQATEESAVVNSDVEQQSSTSSASLSTVKSNSLTTQKKNGSVVSSRDTSSSSINMCRRCHRSGCPTPRDPFSPLPPKISVLPPTPDLCPRHRLKNGLFDSPGRNSPCRGSSQDGNTEDGSEDELDPDNDPPYRALRRFGTLSSLDQDDDLDEQPQPQPEEPEAEVAPSGLRAWSLRATSYVVSKMSMFEQLQPAAQPSQPSQLEPGANADEEGSASGATSGDDIWGTPTSGGPDDDSFPGCSPPSGQQRPGDEDEEEEDEEDEEEDDDEEELNMEQLLGGASSAGGGGGCGLSIAGIAGASSLRCFLGRRRLEPLPEEDDSVSVASSTGAAAAQQPQQPAQPQPQPQQGSWW